MNDKKEILNILIISLDEKFSKNVSSLLASELDMYFVDCKELIEYDLINPKDVLEKCGLEYLRKKERGVLSNACEYQNTVISINYSLYSLNYDLFKYSLVVYLKIDEKSLSEVVNNIEEKNYNDFLTEKADIIVDADIKKKKETKNKLIKLLGENL